jgi:hypothetical protein
MNRSVRIPIALMACVVWAGLALAQPPAPGSAGAPPQAAVQSAAPTAAPQGTGRGGFVPVPVVIGPPALVPSEVVIPRPTAAELAQVNDAVKKFIDSDTSSSRPLLKKFESLLMLQPARMNVAATFTQTVQRQGPRHEGFVEVARQGNIDLLLHGDSITDWWVQSDANKAMFDKYFGAIRTANFAVAGDTTQGVLWGLRNGEPVREKIAEANRIIARLDDAQHVFYLDIGAKFLDDKGVFLTDAFRPDNLHPQSKGYDIWGEAVKDKLAVLLKQD